MGYRKMYHNLSVVQYENNRKKKVWGVVEDGTRLVSGIRGHKTKADAEKEMKEASKYRRFVFVG